MMSAPDSRNSVEYWQRISARWKVIAIALGAVLVLLTTLGTVALVGESAAKIAGLDETGARPGMQEGMGLQAEVRQLRREKELPALRKAIKEWIEKGQMERGFAREGRVVIEMRAIPIPTRNAPTEFVKGRVLKIDETDRTLVRVSLGSDDGVHKDNTLEVYRLQPEPEYLGRLLIREARSKEAVGRLMKPPFARSPLKAGDEVASDTQR